MFLEFLTNLMYQTCCFFKWSKS